ncbi:MAG: hypothetical protein Ct9H300mP12_06660 [Acidimicrobiales bacterium]|nr:MAG: hypothetical protein Ct9H300mP12_06660 [Acidimicrobiales bacterium]
MAVPPNPHLVARMQGHRLSIFGEMSALAVETGASTSGRASPIPTVRPK